MFHHSQARVHRRSVRCSAAHNVNVLCGSPTPQAGSHLLQAWRLLFAVRGRVEGADDDGERRPRSLRAARTSHGTAYSYNMSTCVCVCMCVCMCVYVCMVVCMCCVMVESCSYGQGVQAELCVAYAGTGHRTWSPEPAMKTLSSWLTPTCACVQQQSPIWAQCVSSACRVGRALACLHMAACVVDATMAAPATAQLAGWSHRCLFSLLSWKDLHNELIFKH
jgi:hypothetical protein